MIRAPSDGSVKEIPGPSAAPVNTKSVSLRPRSNCADHDAATAENQSGEFMDIEKFLRGFFSEIDVPIYARKPITLLTGEIAKGRTVYGRKRIDGDWEYYNFPQLKGQ